MFDKQKLLHGIKAIADIVHCDKGESEHVRLTGRASGNMYLPILGGGAMLFHGLRKQWGGTTKDMDVALLDNYAALLQAGYDAAKQNGWDDFLDSNVELIFRINTVYQNKAWDDVFENHSTITGERGNTITVFVAKPAVLLTGALISWRDRTRASDVIDISDLCDLMKLETADEAVEAMLRSNNISELPIMALAPAFRPRNTSINTAAGKPKPLYLRIFFQK